MTGKLPEWFDQSELIDPCYELSKNVDIIKSLKLSPINKIVKAYSNTDLVEEIKNTPHSSIDEIFNKLPGTVLFHLANDEIIAFAGCHDRDTIVCWYDFRRGIHYRTYYPYQTNSEYMQHDDAKYAPLNNWSHILGKSLSKLRVLEYDSGRRPGVISKFEKAIIFETEGGNMVLSYMLMDMFSLSTLEKIPDKFLVSSKIIEL